MATRAGRPRIGMCVRYSASDASNRKPNLIRDAAGLAPEPTTGVP
jgi:hypothetical protein